MKYLIAKLVPLGLILAGLLVACPPPVQPPSTVILRPQAAQVGGVTVAVKASITFVATDDTGKPVDVNWDRSPVVGRIDTVTGEYTAPDSPPASPIVTIKASRKTNPSDFGTLDIVIIAQGSAGISGRVTVDPALLASTPANPTTRSSIQTPTINTAPVIDWSAPHVKGSVLLIGANARTRASSLRGVQVRNITETISSLTIPKGETEQAFAARVAQATGLVVQPEFIYRPMALELPTPNDTSFETQKNMLQMNIQGAWAIQQTVKDNLIAIIDSGINTNHEDLTAGRFTLGKDFCGTFANEICSEDDDPSDIPEFDPQGFPIGNAGHGTAVAGIIAASTNNAKGISGLTWGGKILVVKVFGYDAFGAGTSTSAVAKAIRYAADQGSKVINLSLGFSFAPKATDAGIDEAITYAVGKGVLIFAAAGNTDPNNPKLKAAGVFYPARNPNVIAVGSVNPDNGISSFSAVGPEIALVAPGGDILNTLKAKDPNKPNDPDVYTRVVTSGILSTSIKAGLYETSAGTSEATPQVAAIAGLMLTKNPALTRDQVKNILTSTARNLGEANTFGAGLLQPCSALLKAADPTTTKTCNTTVYVYADFFDGTKFDSANPKSGRVVVDLVNAVGSTLYTLTAKRGGFSSLEAGTYRIVACVNKNSNASACDAGDLGGQKDSVVYNGTTPVANADVTLAPL